MHAGIQSDLDPLRARPQEMAPITVNVANHLSPCRSSSRTRWPAAATSTAATAAAAIVAAARYETPELGAQ